MAQPRFHITAVTHRELTGKEARALPKGWTRNAFPACYVQVYDLRAPSIGAACDHVADTLRACSPGDDPLTCQSLHVRSAAP